MKIISAPKIKIINYILSGNNKEITANNNKYAGKPVGAELALKFLLRVY